MTTVGGWYVLLLSVPVVISRGTSTMCQNNSRVTCSSKLGEMEYLQGTEDSVPVNGSTCNFERDLCGYKARSCTTGSALWQRTVRDYARIRVSQTSVSILESPQLKVTTSSCLTLNASLSSPADMDVYFGTSDQFCQVASLTSSPQTTNGRQSETFRLNVPSGNGKVSLLAFSTKAGTDAQTGEIRIYGLSVEPGVCPLSWEEFVSSRVKPPASSQLSVDSRHSWLGEDNWISSGFSTFVDAINLNSWLLTPVLPPTPSGSRPMCLTFWFNLPERGSGIKSLTVSLVGPEEHDLADPEEKGQVLWKVEKNSEEKGQVLWKVEKNPSSKRKTFQEGQLAIESESAFRIQFLAKRTNTGQPHIGLKDVVYPRASSRTGCPSLPPDAVTRNKIKPHPDDDDDDDKDDGPMMAAIMGALASAVVIIAVVICLLVWWKRRQKRRKSEDTKALPVNPSSAEASVIDGRPFSSHYSEISDVPHEPVATRLARQARCDVTGINKVTQGGRSEAPTGMSATGVSRGEGVEESQHTHLTAGTGDVTDSASRACRVQRDNYSHISEQDMDTYHHIRVQDLNNHGHIRAPELDTYSHIQAPNPDDYSHITTQNPPTHRMRQSDDSRLGGKAVAGSSKTEGVSTLDNVSAKGQLSSARGATHTSSSSALKDAQSSTAPSQNVYHELEAPPRAAQRQGPRHAQAQNLPPKTNGNPTDNYDHLGTAQKGHDTQFGADCAKVYSHLGFGEDSSYDVVQRGRQTHVIDSHYHHLDKLGKKEFV